jgi:hypothetical protein
MNGKKRQNRLTQAEYAAHRGISQSTVSKMIKKGMIFGAFEKEGRRYLIDPIKADAIMKEFLSPEPDTASIEPFSVDPGHSQANCKYVSYAEAARREKSAKAALLELRLKRECGELVERKRVQQVAAKVGTQVRVGLEAIPSKTAPALAGMSSARDIARYLQYEIKSVLSDLSRELEKSDF